MELRFPLDMGILIITCPNCKTSFKMDPDDPRTFLNGKFDLTPSPQNTRFDFLFLNRFKNYLNSAKDIKFLIPIFLFLILLLNLLKIFNSNENVQVEILPKDNQEFEKDIEPEDKAIPEPNPEKPTLEI